MASPTEFLRIANYQFTLAGQSPHTIEDQDLGPAGPVEFVTDDWAAGLLSAEQGPAHVGTPQYLSARGVDAAFPKQLIIQPQATTIAVASGQPAFAAAPLKQVDFTPSGEGIDTFLVTAGRYVYRLDVNGEWTQARDLGVGVTATDVCVHGGRIGIAYNTGYDHSADASSWTTSTTDADRFGVLDANLWRAVRPNSLYAATGFAGTWSSAYTVADSTYNVNSLMGVEQLLLIGKEDGIRTIDSEGAIKDLSPELRPQANANFASLRATTTFNGDYYFRTLNGLIRLAADDGMKYRVGFDQIASPDLPTVVVQALCADDRYLYALCNNSGANLLILRRSVRGAWHVLYADYSAGTKQGQHIAVSAALGYPALFFSYYDGSSVYTTRYIRLSTYANPVDDTNYRFDTTAQNKWIRLGRFGSAEAPTVFDRCTIQSRNLTANVTVTPYYAVDGGAITQFGSSAATTSPLATIHPGAPPAGHLFDFYLYLATNSATTTPIVTGVSFRGHSRPDRRRVHIFTINAGAHQDTARGGKLRRSPVQIQTDLNVLRATNVYVTVTDENQHQFSGMVTNIQRVTEKTVAADTEPGHVYRVTVLEAPAAVGALSYTYGQAVYS